jgi:hypothetical protein
MVRSPWMIAGASLHIRKTTVDSAGTGRILGQAPQSHTRREVHPFGPFRAFAGGQQYPGYLRSHVEVAKLRLTIHFCAPGTGALLWGARRCKKQEDGSSLDAATRLGPTAEVRSRLGFGQTASTSNFRVRLTRDSRGTSTNDGSSARPQQSPVIESSVDERLCFQGDVDAYHELNKSSTIRRPAL